MRVAEALLDSAAVVLERRADGGEVYDAALVGEEGEEGLAHLCRLLAYIPTHIHEGDSE